MRNNKQTHNTLGNAIQFFFQCFHCDDQVNTESISFSFLVSISSRLAEYTITHTAILQP